MMTKKFSKYKEFLYEQMGSLHTIDDNGKEEVKKIIKEKKLNKLDDLLALIFDYGFKCGVKSCLDKIEEVK